MAEELLVYGAGEIVKRVVSLGFDEIGLVLGVKDELQKLHKILINIQQVTDDAEQKQVEERRLIGWLKELKEVAYDAEDLLDDLAYEKLRQHIIINTNNKQRSYYIPGFIKKSLLYCKIAHRIQHINLRLADIDKRKYRFNLGHDPSSSSNPVTNNRQETAAFVDVSTVVGRESKKDEIVAMLLSPGSTASSSNVTATNNDFLTVAIIGLGGIGKTTLAQLVYNDDAVEKHFDLRVWICVSDDFNTTNLFTQILEQIPGCVKLESSTTKRALQNNLQSGLKGKQFLLVLDDVWNENQQEWDDFVHPLKNFGATGSRILVTSRSRKVASIVEAQDTCELEGLSDDDCWALIERKAFTAGGPPKTHNLVEIGKEISKKCKGVPLAVEFLGGLLQSMKRESEWEAVRNAEFQNMLALPGKEYDYVMGILKYCFDSLSPTLKLCFTYCAIFPKDYWISKEILIQLWMAQGFLDTSGTHGELSMEDYGNTYFDSLYLKSFFKDAKLNDFGEVIFCKMHDLVQELAWDICQSECRIIGDNNDMSKDLSKCQHASLMSSNPLEALKEAKKLRTIFILNSDCKLVVYGATTFSDFVLLRVLDLSYSESSKFFSSLHCKLKHLRYLDLSYTSIESLPKWVTQLYNLQTLKLMECDKLIELPEDLKNLKKLRHLFIDKYQKWKKMPQGMGDLVDLQTLPIFVAREEDDGSGISVLKKLDNLRGRLDIHRLCLVKEGSVPKEANLIGKKSKLQELRLHWDRNSSGGGDCNDLHVLEELRPHTNLQRLSLEGFGGYKFPEWVSSGSNLPCLMSMELVDFNYCEHIPSFDELPQLQSIKMKHISGVKSISGAWGASQSSHPLLKKLELRNLPALVEWSGDAGVLFPSLESLILEDVGAKGVLSITSSLTSLTFLCIKNCRQLEFLPKGLLRNNNQLNDVLIGECPKLQALEEGLTDKMDFVANSSLRKLEIKRCGALKSIPNMGFTSIQMLVISGCRELKTIAKGFLMSLVSLESLTLSWCDKFEGFDDNNLTSEQQLVFLPCCHTLDVSYCSAVRCIDVSKFSSLRQLNVVGCGGLQGSRGLSLPTALQKLSTCKSSDYFPLKEVRVNNLLPSLRDLSILGSVLNSLPDQLQHLTMLNSLSIHDFRGLREMPEWLGDLTSLHTLMIRRCSAITSIELPSFSSLRNLEITYCRGLQVLRGLPFLTALEKLVIGKFSEELDCFPSLVGGGDDDEGLTSNNPLLPSLRKIEIHGWAALTSLPHHLQRLTTLRTLSIWYFNSLRELPEWLGGIALLESLEIWGCENLRRLPSKEQMQRLTFLNVLRIQACPHLKRRCRRDGDGPHLEWPKISHIPQIYIDYIRLKNQKKQRTNQE